MKEEESDATVSSTSHMNVKEKAMLVPGMVTFLYYQDSQTMPK
jgi:hypothetical protein